MSSVSISWKAASRPSALYSRPIFASTEVGLPMALRKWFELMRANISASMVPSRSRIQRRANSPRTASPIQACSCSRRLGSFALLAIPDYSALVGGFASW